MKLVTLGQVRQHCRVDFDDELLKVYAEAAEQAAEDFLGRRVFPDTAALADAVIGSYAGDDPMVVNQAIVAAVLLIAGHLYRNREAVSSEAATELPMGAHALLWPHRVGLGV